MRADRLLQLISLLRRHGRLPAWRIAELLEVSERTVLRDMEALSAAGVPVFTEPGRNGGCVLLDDFQTDVSGLTPDEAQAMFAFASRSAVDDLGLGASLGSALTKLAATVPEAALERADALSSVMVVDRRRWFAAAEEVPVLPLLREAAVRRHQVRLRYRSLRDERPRSRTVHPYGLVENSGVWYLLAAHRGEVKSFRVSRIASARELDAAAVVPDDLDLGAIWRETRAAFESSRDAQELVVAVAPRALDLFRQISTSQALPGGVPRQTGTHPDPDGGPDWVELTLLARGPRAATAMVLGFGGDVLLIGPPHLRRAMIASAEATLARHRAVE